VLHDPEASLLQGASTLKGRSYKKVKTSRLLVLFLVAVICALPVFAAKRIYKATLTSNCVGTKARGSAVLGFTPETVEITVQINNLLAKDASRVGLKHFTDDVGNICGGTNPMLATCPPAEESCTIDNFGNKKCIWFVHFTTPFDQEKLVNVPTPIGATFLQWLNDGEVDVVADSQCTEEVKGTLLQILP
jgi:hypothetical protein